MLLLVGLAGATVLLFVSAAAARSGFESTIERELLELPLGAQLLLVAFIAPLAEEFAFRTPLTARPRLGVTGFAAAFGFGYFWFGGGPTRVVSVMFGLALAACIVLWLQALASVGSAGSAGEPIGGVARPPWRDAAARWWSRNAGWPVWVTVAAFACVHLSNYEVEWSSLTLLAAPAVVGPQIWLGLMFTIARVRYGWWAAVGLHSAHNVVVWAITSALIS